MKDSLHRHPPQWSPAEDTARDRLSLSQCTLYRLPYTDQTQSHRPGHDRQAPAANSRFLSNRFISLCMDMMNFGIDVQRQNKLTRIPNSLEDLGFFCTGTLQNLTVRELMRHLHRNPPELCTQTPASQQHPAAPEPFGTAGAVV